MKKKNNSLWFHKSINAALLQSILKMNQPWYPWGDGWWGLLGFFKIFIFGYYWWWWWQLMTFGEIFLAVPAKDIRERERETKCGFFLRANNRESVWDTLGNEKPKWCLGQNNRRIHWTRHGQLKGLLRWSKPPLQLRKSPAKKCLLSRSSNQPL